MWNTLHSFTEWFKRRKDVQAPPLNRQKNQQNGENTLVKLTERLRIIETRTVETLRAIQLSERHLVKLQQLDHSIVNSSQMILIQEQIEPMNLQPMYQFVNRNVFDHFMDHKQKNIKKFEEVDLSKLSPIHLGEAYQLINDSFFSIYTQCLNFYVQERRKVRNVIHEALSFQIESYSEAVTNIHELYIMLVELNRQLEMKLPQERNELEEEKYGSADNVADDAANSNDSEQDLSVVSTTSAAVASPTISFQKSIEDWARTNTIHAFLPILEKKRACFEWNQKHPARKLWIIGCNWMNEFKNKLNSNNEKPREDQDASRSDDWQEIKEFEEGTECPICLDEKCPTPHQLPCGHVFGWNCLKQHLETRLTEGQTVTCPLCTQLVENQSFDEFGFAELHKWVAFQSWAQLNPTWIKPCATDHCPGFHFAMTREKSADVCVVCRKNYCFGCQSYHEIKNDGQFCKNFQDWKKSNDRVEEEFKTLFKKGLLKRCPNPNCLQPIEKAGGCLHMICNTCRYEFWWNNLSPYICARCKTVTDKYIGCERCPR